MSSFPIFHLENKKSIYFPGCSMLGFGKEINVKLKRLLEEKLSEKLGCAILCCGDFMWHNGDRIRLSHHHKLLEDRFENAGVEKIFVACANCKKVFKEFLNEVEIVYIYIFGVVNKNDFKDRPKILIFFICGIGGSASKINKSLSLQFSDQLKNVISNKQVLTGCFGCRKRFSNTNIKANHLYGFLTGIFFKKPITNAKQWVNRFYTSISLKLNLIKILLLLLIIFLSLYVHNLQIEGKLSLENVLLFLRSSKYIAPLIYLFMYSVGPSIFFPSLLMTVSAGVIWGPYFGFVFAMIGATLGSSVSFLLARYLFTDFVKKTFGIKRWKRLSELVNAHDWKIVAFTRIVPIFPFPVLNYLFGITPISFFQYLWHTIIFMMPACLAFVFLGSSILDLILKGGDLANNFI